MFKLTSLLKTVYLVCEVLFEHVEDVLELLSVMWPFIYDIVYCSHCILW